VVVRRATLRRIRMAEETIARVHEHWENARPMIDTLSSLDAARFSLGTGPKKGPKIEAAWRRVALKYEATKNLALRDIANELALPKDWRSR
jgi:hypothetical protein